MRVPPALVSLAAAHGFDVVGAFRRAWAATKAQTLPILEGADDLATLDRFTAAVRPTILHELLAELNAHQPAGARHARRAWKADKASLARGLADLAAATADALVRDVATGKGRMRAESATFTADVAGAFD